MRINLTLAPLTPFFRAFFFPLPPRSLLTSTPRSNAIPFISAPSVASSPLAALPSSAAGYKVARRLLVFPRLFKLYVQLIFPPPLLFSSPSPVPPQGFSGAASYGGGRRWKRRDSALKIPREETGGSLSPPRQSYEDFMKHRKRRMIRFDFCATQPISLRSDYLMFS